MTADEQQQRRDPKSIDDRLDLVLDLLRGKVNDRKDNGLVGEVQDLRREIQEIKKTHAAVKKYAALSGLAALSAGAAAAKAWLVAQFTGTHP